MGRITVKEKKKMEILGLTIDSRGNWSEHIQAIASDARNRLGAIRRMSHRLDDQSTMRAYIQSFCVLKDWVWQPGLLGSCRKPFEEA